ncbi:hypothetical protein [Actinomyces capricornis]|uniref:Uncharacterized protein n=1 Tax=Actinomyces capricornis TaxID=2755559 RepID=A0ABM7UDZ4_9ACTO|nr:hypothetical protein [Actinomyces capricornis]BDA65380.1 hypothetical protein MANAM107_22140 [Actinomyces capricornis]
MHHDAAVPGALYAATLVDTAVLAGFMISYVITIDAFFSHALRTGRRRHLPHRPGPAGGEPGPNLV